MASSLINLKESTKKETPEHEEAPPPRQKLAEGTILRSWEAPEYIVYKKSTTWYMAFGIVFALLLFSAFLLKSFLSGVVFLLSGILIFLYSERPPRMTSYDVRTTGIRIHTRVFLYRELESFNVVERGDEVYMLLKSRRLVSPLLHIPLGDENPQEIQTLLQEHLPLDEQFVEPLPDILAHWLGF